MEREEQEGRGEKKGAKFLKTAAKAKNPARKGTTSSCFKSASGGQKEISKEKSGRLPGKKRERDRP